MNKIDLVKAVSQESGLTQKDVRAALNGLEAVLLATAPTEEVRVLNGLSITFRDSEARIAKNPMTGENVEVPAKRHPKAKFGRAFKDAFANVAVG